MFGLEVGFLALFLPALGYELRVQRLDVGLSDLTAFLVTLQTAR